MIRKFLIIAAAASFLSAAPSSFAHDAETSKPAVKMSKKEKKALAKKTAEVSKIAAMCKGAMVFNNLDMMDGEESAEYLETQAFWKPHFDKALEGYTKPKKRNKKQMALVTEGSNALTRLGGGNIMLGAKKAGVICRMMQSENLDGPTTQMLLGQ